MDESQNVLRGKQEKVTYFKFSFAAASQRGPDIWLYLGRPKMLAKNEMEGTGDHRRCSRYCRSK